MSDLSEAAQQLKDQEDSTFLSRVPYDKFWGKVKLVGYTMKLRPDHLRQIADDINLDYDKKILCYEDTTEKFLLCDEMFGYKDGENEPRKLLLTGFVYCNFRNEVKHMEHLWHLMNPNFKTSVPLDTIMDTVDDLVYLAIDQRLDMLDDEDEEAAKQRLYLEQCESAKNDFFEKLRIELTDNDPQVTQIKRAKFDQVIIPAFSRLSNLRQLILHKAKGLYKHM